MKKGTAGGRGSRQSSRLNNPELAAKHKAFMAKVTAATKGSMDTYLTNEIISETMPGKLINYNFFKFIENPTCLGNMLLINYYRSSSVD